MREERGSAGEVKCEICAGLGGPELASGKVAGGAGSVWVSGFSASSARCPE